MYSAIRDFWSMHYINLHFAYLLICLLLICVWFSPSQSAVNQLIVIAVQCWWCCITVQTEQSEPDDVLCPVFVNSHEGTELNIMVCMSTFVMSRRY